MLCVSAFIFVSQSAAANPGTRKKNREQSRNKRKMDDEAIRLIWDLGPVDEAAKDGLKDFRIKICSVRGKQRWWSRWQQAATAIGQLFFLLLIELIILTEKKFKFLYEEKSPDWVDRRFWVHVENWSVQLLFLALLIPHILRILSVVYHILVT